MIWLLFTSLSMASVVLVPKPGFIQKQVQMPFEQPPADDPSLEVVLKKTEPAPKIAKNKKSKKKKKKKFKHEAPDDQLKAQEENLDSVYENEVKLLNSQKTPSRIKHGQSADYRVPNSLNENEALLEQVEKKYTTNFIQMDLSKETTQAVLERTKDYSGTLALGPRGQLKMNINEPQKSSLIMDGKNIWVIDYPVDDTQNKVQILHSRTKKNLKDQAFLGSLLSGGGLLKSFKIKTQSKVDDETKFKLIPKQKGFEIKRLELSVDSHDQLITNLTYWDQLGNKTELKFKKQKFNPEVPKDFFKYEPPKDANISEL